MISTLDDVSVIICAYTEKRWDDLLAAVASLHAQIPQPGEIIIVIDHNQRLFERAQAYISNVIIVENSANRGLSGARNTGLALAHGAFIAFLDDDAEAEPDWLIRLVRCCTDPQVLGAGGTVVPRWQGPQPAWFPHEFYWVIGCTYLTPPAHPIAVRNPFGGCTCIKREVFQTIGGFREGIGRVGNDPMGGEETELSIRATQHWPDKVFLYEPHARIHHHIPIQRAHWRYFFSRCYAEGISKSIVSRYVGAKDSLSSERNYTLRILPQGIMHNLASALFRRNRYGLARAAAIVAGLACTTTGYCIGHLFSPALKAQKDFVDSSINDKPSASLIS